MNHHGCIFALKTKFIAMNDNKSGQRILHIPLRTIDWTEGEHVWFDAKMTPDSSITVQWGDGKHSTLKPYNDGWARVEHYYAYKDQQYLIEFISETPECLIELVDGTWETDVEAVYIDNCPSLQLLQYHNVPRFDFSGCPNLEALDAESYYGSSIDLSGLTKLSRLRLYSANKIKSVDLTKNKELELLDISFSCLLKKVAISNNSKLKHLSMKFTELDPHSVKWLNKALEVNDGEIDDTIFDFRLSTGILRDESEKTNI